MIARIHACFGKIAANGIVTKMNDFQRWTYQRWSIEDDRRYSTTFFTFNVHFVFFIFPIEVAFVLFAENQPLRERLQVEEKLILRAFYQVDICAKYIF